MAVLEERCGLDDANGEDQSRAITSQASSRRACFDGTTGLDLLGDDERDFPDFVLVIYIRLRRAAHNER